MTSNSASRGRVGPVQAVRFSSRARACGVSRPAISYLLPAGQAMTVQVRESGVLRVSQGRLWLTFDQTASDRCAPAGDYFLARCESLLISAGQTVVIESWPPAVRSAESMESAALPACISWETNAPRRALAGLRDALGQLAPWRR